MRCVRWNVDGLAGSRPVFVAAKCEFNFAVEQDECLFKIVAMGSGAATRWHMHVDDAEFVVGVFTGYEDGVGVAHEADVLQFSFVILLRES